MKTLEAKQQIALKNILFATDLDVSLIRALPFAVALARRYGAKLYVAYVVPQAVYSFAHPESGERILKEAQHYANYALHQTSTREALTRNDSTRTRATARTGSGGRNRAGRRSHPRCCE